MILTKARRFQLVGLVCVAVLVNLNIFQGNDRGYLESPLVKSKIVWDEEVGLDTPTSDQTVIPSTDFSSISRTIEAEGVQDVVEFIDDNEGYFDMVFWSETPMISNHVTPSDFFLVHTYTHEESRLLEGLQQVFRIDFRVCNATTGTCPPYLLFNQSELASLKEYQRIQGKNFHLVSPKVQRKRADRLIWPRKLRAVTFWSQQHQQHVRFTYTHSLRPEPCYPCPQECPRQPADYPYMFDPRDRLCKSTHPDAMPPKRRFGGRCGCASTCHTPEAVAHHSIWPWKNETERNFFDPYWNNTAKKRKQAQEQSHGQKQRLESPSYSSYQARFPCNNITNTEIPLPIAADFSHHLFYMPQIKLIFCGIPKAGITEWLKFLRFTMGARDYVSLPHYKVDRYPFNLKSLEISRAQELLNDPSWTKAVFFRNPFERLVSAYQDKIARKGYTQKVFHIGNLKDKNRTVLTFAEFVDKVTATANLSDCSDPNGLSACTDPHWKPQLMICGLDYLLPKFDFVGSFDYVAEHTKMLLEKIGAWETMGRWFDDGNGVPHDPLAQTCYALPAHRKMNETVSGFNQGGTSLSGRYVHKTDSKSKMEEFYTPDLIEKVRRAYALDFSVWDEISNRSVDEISRGKDMNVVREHCERAEAT